MVFGLFEKGKIDIILEKNSFSHGEIVKGCATLKLKKPINAKAVLARIYAEQVSNSFNNGKMQQQKRLIFDFSVPLDGEKEYSIESKTYDFQLQVPAKDKIEVEGKLGDALKTINALGNMMSNTKWFVEVKLDIPKGFDVSKKLQINVTQQN